MRRKTQGHRSSDVDGALLTSCRAATGPLPFSATISFVQATKVAPRQAKAPGLSACSSPISNGINSRPAHARSSLHPPRPCSSLPTGQKVGVVQAASTPAPAHCVDARQGRHSLRLYGESKASRTGPAGDVPAAPCRPRARPSTCRAARRKESPRCRPARFRLDRREHLLYYDATVEPGRSPPTPAW